MVSLQKDVGTVPPNCRTQLAQLCDGDMSRKFLQPHLALIELGVRTINGRNWTIFGSGSEDTKSSVGHIRLRLTAHIFDVPKCFLYGRPLTISDVSDRVADLLVKAICSDELHSLRERRLG